MSSGNPTETPRRPPAWRRRLTLALAATTMIAGVAGYYLGQSGAEPVIGSALAAPPPVVSLGNQQAPGTFADLAARVKPAVVQVTAAQIERAPANPVPPELRGTPFEEFFRRFGPPGGGQPRRGMSLGSGFIVDPAGYIVTNNHVVSGGSNIEIKLTTGESYDAKLVGRDEKTDLALLKIEPRGKLPYVAFGGDDELRVGDWVMAVGNPFGLDGTVTVGVLSARGRNIGAGPYDDFLQIDAPINRGNSGGPTFDLQGRVVGINTAIFSPNGGSIGIGFAVPASLAKPVIEQLKAKGTVERGWLGVQMQPINDQLAKALKLEKPQGALIAAVEPESPAAKAGIRTGDVVTEFGGHKIGEPRDLAKAVAETPIGQPAKVTVRRDGKTETLSVRTTAGSEQQAKAESAEEPTNATLGLALAPLDGNLRARLGLDDAARGAVVTDIDEDSPAAEVGIRPGDVITEVGGAKVGSPADVAKAVERERAADKQATALLVVRRGVPHYVALPLGRA